MNEVESIPPAPKNDADCISRQAAIDVEGLDEQIRCEMCRNPMHTNRGCDGNCKYDEKLYERIMQILGERIKPLPSAQPEEVTPHRNYQYLSDYWCECGWHLGKMGDVNYCPNCGKKVKWDG